MFDKMTLRMCFLSVMKLEFEFFIKKSCFSD